MRCRWSERTGVDCGCSRPQEYYKCRCEERLAKWEERTDAAAFFIKVVDEEKYVNKDYCNSQYCVDFSPMECAYGTLTERKWVDSAECKVVECRHPVGSKDFTAFGEANKVGRFRKACDEHFQLIPNADYILARSGYCTKEDCPLFKQKE